ncbi:MAG: hypothetical protein Kow0069_38430 [Promethearchaeota archaeon]
MASEVHLTLVENPPPYGPLEYVAWVVGFVGPWVGYLALVTPAWFRRRVFGDAFE